MVSIVLPQKMSEELDALISLGYYDNRSEIVREALRNFLSQKPEVRLVAAIKLYKDEKITISRAAEIAGVSFDEMKNILIDEGIIRRGKKDSDRSSELEEMKS
jgi:Arc/MetJ-type ribon-helix-helix transcriptional regulator